MPAHQCVSPDHLETGRLAPVAEIALQRTGRRPSPSTVWRWCRRGTRAGLLPATFVYGCWCTTAAAFAAWLDAGTAATLRGRESSEDSSDRAGGDDEALRAAGLL